MLTHLYIKKEIQQLLVGDQLYLPYAKSDPYKQLCIDVRVSSAKPISQKLK